MENYILGASVQRVFAEVLGCRIHALSQATLIDQVIEWARLGESRSIFFCNAHVLATAAVDDCFSEVVQSADLCAPDGAPVAWMMRKLGVKGQSRVDGPDSMLAVCKAAEQAGVAVYLYGGTEITLSELVRSLHKLFPSLIIRCESPPFRSLSSYELTEAYDRINASGCRIVFVGLGCPKQEAWMRGAKGKVDAVMLGVGAAFDFHAGVVQRAPIAVRKVGMEWFYRFLQEPKRLWKRYLVSNCIFIKFAFKQLYQMRRLFSW